VVVVLAALAIGGWIAGKSPSGISPLQARIVSIAQGQVGYRTDPSNTYCNRFSAYWDAGTDDCGNGNRSEEWCADFAAWVWKQAGAQVTYELAPNYLNADSASFYVWGLDHGTWHPVSSHYRPQPGDVAIYGLDVTAVTAQHVAIVTGATAHNDAPDVINGDGDRSGFSVVEAGTAQDFGDVKGHGAPLSGYVSPSEPAPAAAPAS
jgi:CHAP domain